MALLQVVEEQVHALVEEGDADLGALAVLSINCFAITHQQICVEQLALAALRVEGAHGALAGHAALGERENGDIRG